jgi:FtsP/CotA-like multicopper oxidase with cupredoxin domain
VIGGVLAGGLPTNLSAIPSEIFDVCTPTNATREVINVHQSSTSKETWLAIDIIATFGLVTGSFSIDGHPLWVYAVDGAYIVPQLVEAITVTNGDRYSVLIKLDKQGKYRVRFASTTVAQMLAGYATLSYGHLGGAGEPTRNNTEPEAYINDVGVNTTASVRFFDQLGMRSFPPDFVSSVADQTFKLAMRVAGASYNWALNSSIYPMQLDNDEPLLFHPLPNEHNNVTISTLNNTWVDLIFVAVTSPMPPHPIHKHGNKMWLIGQGDGMFNYSSVAEAAAAIPEAFNLVDPPKRDGFATPPAITGPVWMAVRYQVTNPGAWFMHCHIQSHMLGGMSMAIQDGVDQWPAVPDEYLNYH